MNHLIMPLLSQGDGMEQAIGQLGRFPVYILCGYLVLLLILGVFGWLRSHADEEDYYLAGRGQGWLVSSVTIMATFFSSFALLGAPGMVYREGLMFALFSLNVPFAGLCVYVLGSRIWRAGRHFGFVTPGDMVADYYDSRIALKLLVAVTSVLYVLPYVVMQIQSGGILSEKLFPGSYNLGMGSLVLIENVSSYSLGATVLAAITMLYIMIGGMRSVAWTDLVQGILLIAGMLVSGMAMLVVFNSPAEFGQRLTAELPESSLTIPGNTGVWPWTMIMTVCLLASTGSMVQPAQWMRFYSARDSRVLKRGAAIFAVLLTSCFLFGVMLIGLAGQLLYPLTFSISQQLEPAAEADPAVGEQINARGIAFEDGHTFEYSATDGLVRWSWTGRNSREITPEQEQKILSSLTDARQAQAVQRLVQESRSGEQRPEVAPHPEIQDYNSVLVSIISVELPRQFRTAGAIVASLILVAIMAASMSTADSNLHALSAVLTRDVYDQFLRPTASERERVWVGRAVIALVTVLALWVVIGGRDPDLRERYDVLAMIAQMGLMAIAFSAQLLPITIDMLFIRRGTRTGAVCGLAAGLVAAFFSGPLFSMLIEATGRPDSLVDLQSTISGVTSQLRVHGSVWGLAFNIPIFFLVSLVTRRPDEERLQTYAEVMR